MDDRAEIKNSDSCLWIVHISGPPVKLSDLSSTINMCPIWRGLRQLPKREPHQMGIAVRYITTHQGDVSQVLIYAQDISRSIIRMVRELSSAFRWEVVIRRGYLYGDMLLPPDLRTEIMNYKTEDVNKQREKLASGGYWLAALLIVIINQGASYWDNAFSVSAFIITGALLLLSFLNLVDQKRVFYCTAIFALFVFGGLGLADISTVNGPLISLVGVSGIAILCTLFIGWRLISGKNRQDGSFDLTFARWPRLSSYFTAIRQKRCLVCGYDIRVSSSARCSECGYINSYLYYGPESERAAKLNGAIFVRDIFKKDLRVRSFSLD